MTDGALPDVPMSKTSGHEPMTDTGRGMMSSCACCSSCREGHHDEHEPGECRCVGECDYDGDPCWDGAACAECHHVLDAHAAGCAFQGCPCERVGAST